MADDDNGLSVQEQRVDAGWLSSTWEGSIFFAENARTWAIKANAKIVTGDCGGRRNRLGDGLGGA